MSSKRPLSGPLSLLLALSSWPAGAVDVVVPRAQSGQVPVAPQPLGGLPEMGLLTGPAQLVPLALDSSLPVTDRLSAHLGLLAVAPQQGMAALSQAAADPGWQQGRREARVLSRVLSDPALAAAAEEAVGERDPERRAAAMGRLKRGAGASLVASVGDAAFEAFVTANAPAIATVARSLALNARGRELLSAIASGKPSPELLKSFYDAAGRRAGAPHDASAVPIDDAPPPRAPGLDPAPAPEPPSRHWMMVEKLHGLAFRMVQERSEEGWEFLRQGIPSDAVVHGLGPHGVAAAAVLDRRLMRQHPYEVVMFGRGFSPVFYRGTKKTLTADAATVGGKNPEEKFLRHEDAVKTYEVANVPLGTLAYSGATGIVALVSLAMLNPRVVLDAEIESVAAVPAAGAEDDVSEKTVARNARTGERVEHETTGLAVTALGLGPDLISREEAVKRAANPAVARFGDPESNVVFQLDEQGRERPLDTREAVAFTANQFMYYQGTFDEWQGKWPAKEPRRRALGSLFRRGATNSTVIIGGGDSARMIQMEAVGQSDRVVMVARSVKAQAANVGGRNLIKEDLDRMSGEGKKGELLVGYVMTSMERLRLERDADGRVSATGEDGGPAELSPEEEASVALPPGASGEAWRVRVADSDGVSKSYLADAVAFALGAENPLYKLVSEPTVEKDRGWSNRLRRHIARAVRILFLNGVHLAKSGFAHLIVGPLGNWLRPDLYTEQARARKDTGPLPTAAEIDDPININKALDALQVLIHRTQESVRDAVMGLLGRRRPGPRSGRWLPAGRVPLAFERGDRASFSLRPRTPVPPELAPGEGEAPNPGVHLAMTRLMILDALAKFTAREGDNYPTFDLIVQPGEGVIGVTAEGVPPSERGALEAALRKHPDLPHYLFTLSSRYGGKLRFRIGFLPNGSVDRGSVQLLSDEEYAARLIEEDILENGQPTEAGRAAVMATLRTEKLDSQTGPDDADVSSPSLDELWDALQRRLLAIQNLYRRDPQYSGGEISIDGPHRAQSGAIYYVISVDGREEAVLNIYPKDRYAEAALSIRGAYLLHQERGNAHEPYGMELKDVFLVGEGEDADQIGILWHASKGVAMTEILSEARDSGNLAPAFNAVEKAMETLGRMSRIGQGVPTDHVRYRGHLSRRGVNPLQIALPEWAVSFQHGALVPKHVYINGGARFAGLFAMESYWRENGQIHRFGDARFDIAGLLADTAARLRLSRSDARFLELERAAARRFLAARGISDQDLEAETRVLLLSLPAFYDAVSRPQGPA